ncbi:hypothetical protein [Mucilaginibacter sp.]
MIRNFKLTIDTASQKEVVFNSFDVFDDYEFVEVRYKELTSPASLSAQTAFPWVNAACLPCR